MTPKKIPNFRDLTNRIKLKTFLKPPGQKSRRIRLHEIAARCGISTSYLRKLRDGSRFASTATVDSVAEGLEVSSKVVQAAICRSVDEWELMQ